ncbi:MAG: hypothetical protein ACTHKA_24935 [Anaerocolumna jejuensis]
MAAFLFAKIVQHVSLIRVSEGNLNKHSMLLSESSFLYKAFWNCILTGCLHIITKNKADMGGHEKKKYQGGYTGLWY